MTRLRILWLCSWYPTDASPFNGDFIQRHAKAAALYNDIDVIHVFADDSGKTAQFSETKHTYPGLTEQLISFPRKKGVSGALVAHIKWERTFRKAIREYIAEKGLPDLVHVQVPVRAGLLALWMKRKWKIPFVVTEHWGIYNTVEKLNYAGRSRFFKWLTVSVFKHAAAFFSVSRFLAEGINREVLPVQYTILPNAADTGLFFPSDAASANFTLLHVSNMVPLKNAPGILRAFAALVKEIPGVTLEMIGNTGNELSGYAATLVIPDDRIRFRGEVPYEAVAAAMQNAHALILFSDIENSPCVIGEAACCGLPVIATATGGIPELVNTRNGILVPPGDETALLEAFRYICSNHAVFNRQQIAAAAREIFSYQATGRIMDDVYRKISPVKHP